ncbi:MAG TPA: hypothetical protein VIY51_18950 [Xanthobacteraceae bacterium]
MARRTSTKPLLLILLALAGAGCGISSAAEAADLAIPQRLHRHAAAQDTQAATACCADLIGTANTRRTDSPAETEVAKNARAAQAQFRDLRDAMERAMSLRQVVPKDKLAALDGDMKRLSAQLSARTQSGHLPSRSKAEDALNLAQDWYRASLRVLNPPSDGVTELPLPTNVSDKADLAAAALAALLDEATAYASAPQPVGLLKKRGSNGLRPARSSTGPMPNQSFVGHRG